MRKGQVTIEFVVIAAFMMLMFASLFFTLQGRVASLRQANNYEVMGELGNVVRSEVQMAAQVGGGYKREFRLPTHLNGQEYNVSVEGDWDLTINYRDLQYVTFLEMPVNGSIDRGENVIECCVLKDGDRHVQIS